MTEALKPIGYLSEPISWGKRQSEVVVKITRKPQAEHGFTNPIYASLPDKDSAQLAAEGLPAFDSLDDEVIDAACTAGSLYRVDLMRAYECIRSMHVSCQGRGGE